MPDNPFKKQQDDIKSLSERLKMHNRARSGANKYVISLTAGLLAGGVSISPTEYILNRMIVGEKLDPKILESRIKDVEYKLRKLQERKMGKGPKGLFIDWLRRLKKRGARDWLLNNNEPVLKTRLKKLRAQEHLNDALRDILEKIFYVLATMIAGFVITPYVHSKTHKILSRRSELKRDKLTKDALARLDARIAELEMQQARFDESQTALLASIRSINDVLDKLALNIKLGDSDVDAMRDAQTAMVESRDAYKQWEDIMRSVSAGLDRAGIPPESTDEGNDNEAK